MYSPCSVALESRADRLGLVLLLQVEFPLEHREGCVLRLVLAALRLDRLYGLISTKGKAVEVKGVMISVRQCRCSGKISV